MPLAVQIDLHPRGKVTGRMWQRLTYVTEISGAVPRGDIHAAAQSNGQMGKVATDAHTLGQGLRSRARVPGKMIAKCQM